MVKDLSSSQSLSISPSGTRPVTPDPSESSYLPTEASDEGDILYDQDVEPDDFLVDDEEGNHPDGSEVETLDNLIKVRLLFLRTDVVCIDYIRPT